MNQRNLDALNALLAEFWDENRDGTDDLCEFLASRGVLVPSALTDEEACSIEKLGQEVDLPFDAYPTDDAAEAEHIRVGLERIAKGEQP